MKLHGISLRTATVLAALFVCAALAPSSSAHTKVLLPDGGEEIPAGSMYTIKWTVIIQHTLENWDLYYSNTGPGGPWAPIALDLPGGDPAPGSVHTYNWLVPEDLTSSARIRVVQDNAGIDYEDISGADFSIIAPTPLTVDEVAAGLEYPVLLTSPPGDVNRQFVVEQPGRIRIIKNDVLLARPFLDISDRLIHLGEQGLLGLAFHPDYASNGYFYVNYSAEPEGATIVSRFSVSGTDADSAVAASEAVVLEVAQPYPNHNGGMIAFGPNDGYLYIGMGDGGSGGDPGNNAQTGLTLLGKMLRIDVDGGAPYAIPPDNPFVGFGDVLDEIWALGLRNPWRWCFDPANGDLWIADVGQGDWEEIDFQAASSAGGENYGWRLKEGNHCYNPTTNCDPMDILDDPIYEYEHVNGPRGFRCSVTGGVVYRGCAIPDLAGTYFFSDYCTGETWSMRYDGANVSIFQDRTDELFGVNGVTIAGYGQDARGEVYILEHASAGRVFKIVPDGVASMCEAEPGCCTDRVGDANGSGDDEPTIGDVSSLIDALFISGNFGLLPCLAEADINQSGGADPVASDITIGDVSYLIDYLFITGTGLGLPICL